LVIETAPLDGAAASCDFSGRVAIVADESSLRFL
jgi:hypothetical protein